MEINGDDMTKFLLNINLKTLKDNNIIKNNVNKISKILSEIDEVREKHKYLCLSCIFGAFLGDSMGSCCEFSSPSKNNHIKIFEYKNGIFAPGEVTDDSEMAISAAFAYIDAINEDPSIIQDLLYYYFCIWRCTGPKDIGHATQNALMFWNCQSIQDTEFNYKIVSGYNSDSLANGFLMRISTFIVYYYYSHLNYIETVIQNYFSKENNEITKEIKHLYYDIYIESSKNTQITHPNCENGISSAVFTLMTLAGMVTNDANKVYILFKKISSSDKFFNCHKKNSYEKYTAQNVKEKYIAIIKEVESGKIMPVFSLMGYYIHGFKLSVYFIKKLIGKTINENTYYDIMCEVCDFGGDTDTNCAIVGAMIGPLIGYKKFKKIYFDKFITFIPEKRSQFNSAFMYIYVNYLEENLLKSHENQKNNNIKEKGENNTEKKEENEGKINSNNKQDNIDKKEEKKGGGFLNSLFSIFKSSSSDNKIKKENFKYTAYKKISEFLNKELN